MGKTFHILEKDFIWYHGVTAGLQDTKPTVRLQRSERPILELLQEGRVYRVEGSMKYKFRAKRLGTEWYKICTKSYFTSPKCVSVP
jgi:hypothetical protein